jgi:reactive chlorine resistance protein C
MNRYTEKLQSLGAALIRYGLAAVILFIGALKFTRFEAENIRPLVAHSPLLFWLQSALGVRGSSNLLGIIEIAVGLGILAYRFAPRLSGLASLGACGMFLITLSFLVTTPGAAPWGATGPGQFLLKDVVLLGAALYTAGVSFQARARVARPAAPGRASQSQSDLAA